MRISVSLSICLACVAIATMALAEITPREARRFCVDIALLKDGVELRGAVISRDEKELRMAVQRDWLTAKHQELMKQIDEESVQNQAASRNELLQRIETWKEERVAEQRLVSVLKQELDRLRKAPPAVVVPDSQFVIVVTPANRVRKVYTAADASRRLAKVAWRERIARVEDTAFGPLKVQVEQAVPEGDTTEIDLADRLPAGQTQSDDEWSARQAIFEYEYGERLDFQGTGKMLVRVGEGAGKPDLAELFAKTAADALQGELGGLGLNLGSDSAAKQNVDTDWQATAIQQAKSLDRRGFRVTRVPQITGSGPASVSTSFFARLSDGKYHMIWSNDTTTDPATVKEDVLNRIQQDPQVQEILKVAQALSLGQDATTAVRFGAAVQASLDASENRFFEFRQRYNATLDGPLLVLSARSLRSPERGRTTPDEYDN